MENLVEQILEGDFIGGLGGLDFSCSKVALVLAPGTLYEGTFAVYGNGEGVTEGFVTSTDLRMECLTRQFQGTEDYIGYRFHGERLKAGETVTGEFHIVSSRGEYRLPFEVRIEREKILTSQGELASLRQFAALARENWSEAVKVFYSGAFGGLVEEWDKDPAREVFFGQKGRLIGLYLGLSARGGSQHNLEEFLIAAGQKPPVEYLVREAELVLENPVGIAESAVTVVRNGWGYTRLEAEAEGSFLFVEKELLTQEDFEGNRCRLPFYVDSARLHHGRNYGRIRLTDDSRTLTAQVTVLVGRDRAAAGEARREKKRVLVRLMELYQAHRLKKISSHTWLKESGVLVERLVSMDDGDVMARLFQAQLLITRERFHEANWILEHSLELIDQSQNQDAALYAYYLYLTTLLKPEAWHLKQVAEEMEELYRHHPESWQIAWLLLFLSPEYNRKPSVKWDFLEKQFEQGCTSPLMYLEALQLLNNDPVMLRGLKRYEIQVLYYGSRQGMLSPALIDQMVYLAGKVREFSPILLRILKDCYEKRNTPALLNEICSQMIKGGKVGTDALPWYERGLEQEIRLTKLYEYYLMSVDVDQDRELSKKALLYFSYQTNLDYEHTAYLYRYVAQRREKDPELFASYRERIEYFLLDQIKKEHINRDLAYLYRELLTPELFQEQIALPMTKLLFACPFKVEDAKICRAVCYRPGLRQVGVYPVTNGYAWVPLYHDGDVVILEDTKGNRSLAGVGSQAKRLLDPEQFLGLTCFYALDGVTGEFLKPGVFPNGRDSIAGSVTSEISQNLGFARYVWEHGEKNGEEERFCGSLLAGSDEVEDSLRQAAMLRLLGDYEAGEDWTNLDRALEQIRPELLDQEGRARVLELLMSRGRLDRAYQWLEDYGPSAAGRATLLQILSRRIERADFPEEEVMLQSAAFAFRKGNYDGNVLHYLALHFKGLTEELAAVWKACRSYGTVTWEQCSRILLQMLYSGVHVGDRMEIFRYYVSQGADPAVEEAFLFQCAQEYFMEGTELEDFAAREIGRMYLRGEGVRLEEKLAYLCYFSGKKKSDKPEEEKILQEFLQEMMAKGIYLEAFRSLPVDGALLEPMQDKTIVEYRAGRDGKTDICYRIWGREETAGAFLREEMREICRGLYCKEFVLFFGESLQYQIEEETEDGPVCLAQGEVHKEETPSNVLPCRYEMINDILLAEALEDYETLDKLLEEYKHREYLNDGLFRRR